MSSAGGRGFPFFSFGDSIGGVDRSGSGAVVSRIVPFALDLTLVLDLALVELEASDLAFSGAPVLVAAGGTSFKESELMQ